MRHSKLSKEKASRWGRRSAGVRLADALEYPVSYPAKRAPGKIEIKMNGQELVVDLIPKGHCHQWLAIFNGEPWRVAGMAKIHAEIRKRMPPRLSEYSM